MRAATVLLLAACAHAPPAPPGALEAFGLERVYCVDPPACEVYRSPQPSPEQAAFLVRTYGIRSVIKLNKPSLPFDGGRDTWPDGVELYEHPWWPAGGVSRVELKAALDDLDAAAKPALVHCEHGEDRTGLLIGLWRVRHGALAFAAAGEMRAFGFHPALLGLSDAFEDATGERP